MTFLMRSVSSLLSMERFRMIARMLLFMSLILSTYLSASTISGPVKGNGRFYAVEEDNLSFVKKQLLFNAYREVLTKVLTEQGLNQELFWRSFDEKFELFFKPVQEKLEEKYGVNSENFSEKNKEAFQKSLRIKRLTAKSSFMNLRSCIQSYSIKKMSRSSQMANSRFIEILAKVNKVSLGKIYVNLTREGENRSLKSLYVTVDYNINNMIWPDTGVEMKKDFIDVINNSWKNFLEKNLEGLVGEVIFTTDDAELELKRFSQIPVDVSQSVGEQNPARLSTSFSNSAWLKLKVNLTKLKEDELLMNREFDIENSFILQDLSSNGIIHYNDMVNTKFSHKFDNPQELSSQLATRIYNMPLPKLRELKTKLENTPANQNEMTVLLKNVSNIQEVFSFNNFLQGQGVSFQIQPSIDRLESSEIRIGVRFLGAKEEFLSFLSKLNNENFGKGLFISIDDPERPYVMNIHRKQKENEAELQGIKEKKASQRKSS